MTIHFWDMDHTLIDNDCDVSWKEFLIAQGLAPQSDRQLIDFFYQQYTEGRLDPDGFLAFQLREFVGLQVAEAQALAAAHFASVVRDCVYAGAAERVAACRAAGDRLCLLTATNRIVAEPVAEHFGIDDILATELAVADGRFTGRIEGPYCIADGKVASLRAYCAEHGAAVADAWYYGDSLSDIPVLEAVGHPVAANPMPKLRELAAKRGWEVVDFKV